MRSPDVKPLLNARDDSKPVQPDARKSLEQVCSPMASSSLYPGISTSRIMQAVEQQRRISQQLENLQELQEQRTLRWRTTGLRVTAAMFMLTGVLLLALVLFALAEPALLTRALLFSSDGIGLLLAVGLTLQTDLALFPTNSWLLPTMSLVVVLLAMMWLRLMRTPHEV